MIIGDCQLYLDLRYIQTNLYNLNLNVCDFKILPLLRYIYPCVLKLCSHFSCSFVIPINCFELASQNVAHEPEFVLLLYCFYSTIHKTFCCRKTIHSLCVISRRGDLQNSLSISGKFKVGDICRCL